MGYVGTAPVSGDYKKLDNISSGFNASATAFTLQVGSVNVTPPKETTLLISVGGIMQEPVTAYTVSGSTITFTAAPAAGADFFGVLMGDSYSIGTISDDSVTGAKIVDDAVDSEHIAAGAIDVAHMSANSVDSAQYVNGSIDQEHLAVNSVDSPNYVDGSIDTEHIADNQVTLAKMAGGTDGNIISYDASGDPVAIATGNDGQVLTSTGAGSPPAFEALPSGDAPSGAQTGITTILNAGAKLGRDSQNLIDFATTDNKIILRVNNVDEVELVANVLQPTTNDGVALGTGSLMWSDAFLASGSVLNFNNGNMTVTHSNTVLTVAGGTLATAALTTSTIVASGIIKTDDTTAATTIADGSLQTDGGLSVTFDAVIGDDLILISDAAKLSLGIGADVTLTHDNATGGTLSGTPIVVESLGASALADDNYTGLVLGFIAHEDMDVGQAVYIHTDDGEVGIADANALATMPAIGVVVGADADADAPVKILVQGIYNDADGFDGALTEGATMYLGEAVGAVTVTIPDGDGDFVQVMGVACGPRDVYINPSLDIIERAG